MKKTKNILLLQLSVLIYSLGTIFSKYASNEQFLSKPFIINTILLVILLGIYSILWQQVLKHTSLSFAYINKATSIVWGLLIGFIVFQETVSLINIIGTIVVIAGIILVSLGEKDNG